MYYSIFSDETIEAFEKFYQKSPHLYKKHEKKYNKEYDSPYTYEANNFIPEDIDDWVMNLPKMYEYEKHGYAKVDKQRHLIILSIYIFINETPHIKSRAIYDTETNLGYYFTVKSIGTSPYAMLHCDGKYRMGGYTDYDLFYRIRQRRLDGKSYDILKSVERLKHIPIERFKHINPYTLLDSDDTQWLYQLEILLKMNLIGLATDLHISKRKIEMKYFKQFKKEIMNGIRWEELNILINEYDLSEREKEKAKQRKDLMKLYAKLPKSVFDIGDYILKHPESAKELEHEGNILHHCVSNYLPKIVNGETEVLLLRKKSAPNDPFFTIEIRDGNVVQVRTDHNRTDEAITHLVREWQENRIQS